MITSGPLSLVSGKEIDKKISIHDHTLKGLPCNILKFVFGTGNYGQNVAYKNINLKIPKLELERSAKASYFNMLEER